jgi:hypothetical protein
LPVNGGNSPIKHNGTVGRPPSWRLGNALRAGTSEPSMDLKWLFVAILVIAALGVVVHLLG